MSNDEMPSTAGVALEAIVGKRKLNEDSQTAGPSRKRSSHPNADTDNKTTMSATKETRDTKHLEKANDGESSAKVITTPAVVEKRNAFEELMAPKSKKSSIPPSTVEQSTMAVKLRLPDPISRPNQHIRRNDLVAYTLKPSSVPQELRIYENKDFVAIKDLFPKSTVHTLLLFRSPNNIRHPFHFFEDPAVLDKTREEIVKLKRIVARELERKYGKHSAQDKKKLQVLRGEINLPAGEGLPAGRDWDSEILVGIHARPSMHHVHVHVLSRDLYGDYMTSQKHYQSFNTTFFVDMDEFPLAQDDPRWDPDWNTKSEDLRCWRCKKIFKKGKFAEFREHLAQEFEEWKAE